MNKTSTILVVEDDSAVRNLISTTLQAHNYKYLLASNGETAILEASSHNPDIILLDLGLPDIDGIEIIKKVRSWSNMPIIVISARSEDSDKIEALDVGADDYLTKPFSYNELNARVKALLRRYHVYQGKEKEISSIRKTSIIENLEVNQEHKEVKLNGKKLSLTDLEYEILDYLLLNRKQVISASQLFEAIWHENYYYGANNTIMVHIRNLRKKIEDDPQNPRIIKTVWGKGYYID